MNNRPNNRYRVDTFQRLVTTAEVVDRETGEVVATGETVLSPNDSNDPKLGREIATGRAFKQFLKNERLTTESALYAHGSDAYIEGKKQGFVEGKINSGAAAMDAFLKGVAVGHSQHPEISAHVAFQRAQVEAQTAQDESKLLAPPLTPGPCSRISYERGERVQHTEDGITPSGGGETGTILRIQRRSRESRCEDLYMVAWDKSGNFAYPIKHLLPYRVRA